MENQGQNSTLPSETKAQIGQALSGWVILGQTGTLFLGSINFNAFEGHRGALVGIVNANSEGCGETVVDAGESKANQHHVQQDRVQYTESIQNVLCARQQAALRACVAEFGKAPVWLSLPPRTVNKGICVPHTLQYLQKLAVKGLKVDRVEKKDVAVEGYKQLY
ncbi:hypothetical protein B0H14DRAFT_2599944 [Mycena olivaceomarginata]|nr:hypothetical protein B0H14DRAFT_2599944 [Mycena olivaceomarginata]